MEFLFLCLKAKKKKKRKINKKGVGCVCIIKEKVLRTIQACFYFCFCGSRLTRGLKAGVSML
jgi:hypothetical protein